MTLAEKVPARLATYIVWGCNTGVGKTVVSAALAAASKRLGIPFAYIKPVCTGLLPPHGGSVSGEVSDGEKVASACGARHYLGKHCLKAMEISQEQASGTNTATQLPKVSTLFGWREAVSPHLAVQREGRAVSDKEILRAIEKEHLHVHDLASSSDASGGGLILVEIAGGPLSPCPSGTLFADMLRPLRFPGILVGSAELGGITTTLCAKESLEVRGFDVPQVLVLESESDPGTSLDNTDALREHLGVGARVQRTQPILQDEALSDWIDRTAQDFDRLTERLVNDHHQRFDEVASYKADALKHFWYPFTQQKAVNESAMEAIDSRCGDYLSIVDDKEGGQLMRKFDACGSWWTQGPSPELQFELAKKLGYTQSRYGHCMFPTNVHKPVLDLSKKLVNGPGKGWASRVFYSDNGSTAVEVALKMAFRKFLVDKHGEQFFRDDEDNAGKFHSDLLVLTQKGGYHGDTLAVMDAVEKSVFNGFRQFPWNKQRCFVLEPAYIRQTNGEWLIDLPDDSGVENTGLNSISGFFTRKRLEQQSEVYSEGIAAALDGVDNIAALMIEPVLQGAGGMAFVDPLWQRMLVEYCRSRSIPVIFDEVFVGFYRLGVESTSRYLGIQPDIGCYGKLLTGGAVPMGVTLASEDVFGCFLHDEKKFALLHGHSYTANPIGCAAADLTCQKYHDTFVRDHDDITSLMVDRYWDEDIVRMISHLPRVKSAISLGTVLSVEMAAEDKGYASSATSGIVKKLNESGIYCRPLGNVLYLMCTPFTSKSTCYNILNKLCTLLQETVH